MKQSQLLLAALMLAATPLLNAQTTGVATFEDLNLPANSVWYHVADPDTTQESISTSFRSGDYEFNNLYMPKYDSWAFWSYASKTSKTFSTYATDMWNSCTGSGYKSDTYGVLYGDAFWGANIVKPATARVIPGMMITNAAYVIAAIEQGDGMSPKFDKGDYMKLTAVGVHADASRDSLDIYLADFRGDKPAYLRDWQWVDLSGLGEVGHVEFLFDSTKRNDWGMTTPAFVCVDDFGTSAPESSIADVIDETLPVEYYTLQGIRVQNPENGIFIRVQGKKATKVAF